MRPVTIQRRWQEVECGYCGCFITIDTEGQHVPEPGEHMDDCPRNEMADPR